MIKTKRMKYCRDVWTGKKVIKTITLDSEKRNFNIAHRRENNFYTGYKVLDSKFHEILDIRFYATNGASTCCMWMSDFKGVRSQGSGRATGWGYNRESTAFYSAIKNCGFDYVPSFAGSGVIDFGIKFVMRFLGIDNYHVVTIFG